MRWGFILSNITMTLNIAVSVGYIFQHDWRRAVYWLAVAIATAAITY